MAKEADIEITMAKPTYPAEKPSRRLVPTVPMPMPKKPSREPMPAPEPIPVKPAITPPEKVPV